MLDSGDDGWDALGKIARELMDIVQHGRETEGEEKRESERYTAEPEQVQVQLSISRMAGGGYALRLHFSAKVLGPCMRCLKQASPTVEVEAREVDRPGGGEELDSPYVDDETLDLGGWARDAFALAMPAKILCRDDCAGLCPVWA